LDLLRHPERVLEDEAGVAVRLQVAADGDARPRGVALAVSRARVTPRHAHARQIVPLPPPGLIREPGVHAIVGDGHALSPARGDELRCRELTAVLEREGAETEAAALLDAPLPIETPVLHEFQHSERRELRVDRVRLSADERDVQQRHGARQ
jgi:hypothetical protein